ncbi:hypothetical protein [Kineosporia sp. A_224]|uniref:hypothetical protein n=1 Tax=Kineosporia sp. A_224 TaxID=1962180 RepID=UPI000B4BFF0F|nr:hypothetical protein [Kineosporia sp. A_224]
MTAGLVEPAAPGTAVNAADAVPALRTAPAADRGRTTVSGRALRSVAAAAAAAELGVGHREVHVDLSDDGDRLAVVVRAPVTVDESLVAADGGTGTVLALAEAARQRVARDLTALAGAGVGSCRLVVTAVELVTRGRVGRTEGAVL